MTALEEHVGLTPGQRVCVGFIVTSVSSAGGPGSGKSLQSERMEERFGVRRLTVGDLLCNELQTHSSRGRHLRDALERGEPLPQVRPENLQYTGMTRVFERNLQT